MTGIPRHQLVSSLWVSSGQTSMVTFLVSHPRHHQREFQPGCHRHRHQNLHKRKNSVISQYWAASTFMGFFGKWHCHEIYLYINRTNALISGLFKECSLSLRVPL